MDFTGFEESEENQTLVFSNDGQRNNDEMDALIDDAYQQEDDVSFYRQVDPQNFEHCHKFPIRQEIQLYRTIQPELYNPENIDFVGFDKFSGFEKSCKKFKETMKNFDDSENSIFDAVIYGAMFYKSERKL